MNAVDSKDPEIDAVVAASFLATPDLTLMPETLYRQRLGLPRKDIDADEAELAALAEKARSWYACQGEAWAGAAAHRVEKIEGTSVVLEGGAKLQSRRLARGLAVTDTKTVVVAGFSAGQAVEEEIARLWAADRPDEAQFLNSYAVAVVEHLREAGWHGLNEGTHHTVLPHYSPGYEGWALEDQRVLFELLQDRGPLRLLDSLMLEPAKSMLALYGIACPKTENVCAEFWERFRVLPKPVDSAEYSFSNKVLRKWSRDRLSLTAADDGSVEARFRIDGSTCANMGLPLALDYEVRLTRDSEGAHRLSGFACRPAEGDRGHCSTCLHLSDPSAFQQGMRETPPLLGQPLQDVLTWKPDLSPAGCLCTRSSRDHKWSVVLQTLHYALHHQI